MFHEEIRIKQGLTYISFCISCILYNSKFILKAMSLGPNTVVGSLYLLLKMNGHNLRGQHSDLEVFASLFKEKNLLQMALCGSSLLA